MQYYRSQRIEYAAKVKKTTRNRTAEIRRRKVEDSLRHCLLADSRFLSYTISAQYTGLNILLCMVRLHRWLNS